MASTALGQGWNWRREALSAHLPMSNVDPDHSVSAPLQEAVGETACGQARIKRDAPRHVDLEVAQCSVQLVTGPA